MTHEEAMREKINRQQKNGTPHSFEQSYYKQTIYEIHKFLFWSYKKEVGVKLIPANLCKKCNKLAVEHI